MAAVASALIQLNVDFALYAHAAVVSRQLRQASQKSTLIVKNVFKVGIPVKQVLSKTTSWRSCCCDEDGDIILRLVRTFFLTTYLPKKQKVIKRI